MCGIIGFLGNTKSKDFLRVLKKSVNLLSHRGTDDSGIFVAKNYGLGFTRLAIQDLTKRANQPMFSKNKRYVIVFNGEIYNYKILKKKLEQQGNKFFTNSDTEVLLKLYEIKGKDFIHDLEGMFAIAIIDQKNGDLFLARDRFGTKPLYILEDKNILYFASEIKAFLPFVTNNDISWKINEDVLTEQILFRYISGENTLVKKVKKFPPGAFATYKNGYLKYKIYYDYAKDKQKFKIRRIDEYVEYIEEILVNSIKNNLISDVPIGIALSGGLDSSLLTAIISKKLNKEKINTFSINFNEKNTAVSKGEVVDGYPVGATGKKIDESSFSNQVAKIFETNHTPIILDEKKFSNFFLKSVWHHDEPLNFPNSVGLFLLNDVASKSIKVLLGGEGADELFAGYLDYQNKLDLFTTRSYGSISIINQVIINKKLNLNYKKKLLNKKSLSDLDNKINYFFYTQLQTIQTRLDKMSMAFGIEARVPYLDNNLIKAIKTLPDNMRIKGNIAKYILRKISEKYLPTEIINRPKIGFGVPINEWMKNKNFFGKYVSILEEERTLKRSIYNQVGLKKILFEFRNKNDKFVQSRTGLIWSLLNLEVWIRTFIEDKKPII